jgi:hypothetical protein
MLDGMRFASIAFVSLFRKELTMLKQENEVDKKRFEDLKDDKQDCGCGEREAVKESAHEVKEIRKNEGRSKDPDSV